MNSRRRGVVTTALLAVVTTLVALTSVIVGPAPQADATAYRYWTYWLGGSGPWTFSSRGADRVPADGTVDGWRFAVSEEAGSSSTPRVSSSFHGICGDTDPVAGSKRIGLVIDFGTAADAPPGDTPPGGVVARCIVVPSNANSYEVLVAATSIRVEDGMVCGVGGYPSSGCGEAVANPKPTDSGGGNNGSANDPNNPATGGSGNDEKQSTDHTNSSATDGAAGNQQQASGGPKHPASHGNNNDNGRQKAGPTKETELPTASTTQDALSAASAATLPTTNKGSPLGLVIALAIIAALCGAGFAVARRRR